MAQYRTGTVSVTNGSAVVTGSGTLWQTSPLISVGSYFYRTGDLVAYEVASIDSETQITLTSVYGGVTGSGLTYALQEHHPNGAPKLDNTDVNTAPILNRWLAQSANATDFGTAALADVTTSSTDTTADRVLKVGDFGLGINGVQNNLADLDAVDIPTGLYRYTDATVGTKPPFPSSSSTTVLVQRNSSTTLNQIAIFNGSQTVYIAMRIYASGGWGEWQELYHTGNLNRFEFGSDGTTDIIAVGSAFNATTAVFYLPVDLYAYPSSITVTGSFNVVGVTGATYGQAATVQLNSVGSNKLVRIVCTGLSGMTVGQIIYLQQVDATSKITVNP